MAPDSAADKEDEEELPSESELVLLVEDSSSCLLAGETGVTGVTGATGAAVAYQHPSSLWTALASVLVAEAPVGRVVGQISVGQ